MNGYLLSNNRLIKALVALLILTVLIGVLGCQPASTPEADRQENASMDISSDESIDINQEPSEVPRISKEELMQKLKNGDDVIIVDTRYKAEYDRNHIKGAISAPYSEIVLRRWQPQPEQEVVLYCG